MGIMNGKTATEFDPNGKRLVSAFDEFASGYLTHPLRLLFYLAPLGIGLQYSDVLIKSPLVKFVGAVAGLLGSAISWIPAFLIPGLVFGQWEFATRVFKVYGNNDFSLAMGLVFLLIPLARFLTSTIDRSVISYTYRKVIFIMAVVLAISSLASIVEHTQALPEHHAYSFSFTVIGIVYFIMLDGGKQSSNTFRR